MKAVIFDLDGVIIDSLWVWDILNREYLKSLGYSPKKDLDSDIEELSLKEGYRYLKREYNINKSIKEIEEDIYLILENYYKNQIDLKKDILYILSYLKKEGYILCIGTASDKRLAKLILEKYNIDGFFLNIYTEDLYKKDDIEFYYNISKDLNIDLKDIYLIDDSSYVIETVKNLDINTIGIYDRLSYKKSIKYMADYFIYDLKELEDIL